MKLEIRSSKSLEYEEIFENGERLEIVYCLFYISKDLTKWPKSADNLSSIETLIKLKVP